MISFLTKKKEKKVQFRCNIQGWKVMKIDGSS